MTVLWEALLGVDLTFMALCVLVISQLQLMLLQKLVNLLGGHSLLPR